MSGVAVYLLSMLGARFSFSSLL